MRRLGTKRSCLAAACGLILLAASGCAATGAAGAGSAGPQPTGEVKSKVTISFAWWGNPDRAASTDQAVAAFEKLHPNISVQTSYAAYGSYKAKLATQVAGHNLPDLMQLDYRQISQYASSGELRDLARSPQLHTDRMNPALLRTGRAAGGQYAVPMGVGTQVMAYNAELWRKAGLSAPQPGWTWQQWEAAAKKVAGSPAAKAAHQRGTTDPGWMEDGFEVWLRGTKGKQLYTANGGLGFTARDLAEYWTMCTRLRKAGTASTAEQTAQVDGATQDGPMGKGESASEFSWDAPSSGFAQTPVGSALALAPMPAGAHGMGQYLKPAMLLGISARSSGPKAAAAAELADFLLNTVQAGKILGVDRGTPVNKDVAAKILPAQTGFNAQLTALQAKVKPRLADPPTAPPRGDNALQDTFQNDYEQASFGKQSARSAAEEYVTEAKAELTQ
jgi:multiple sugar transport system substrate-binding protein